MSIKTNLKLLLSDTILLNRTLLNLKDEAIGDKDIDIILGFILSLEEQLTEHSKEILNIQQQYQQEKGDN